MAQNYQVTVELSQQEIDNILDSALGSAGIWYWANDTDIRKIVGVDPQPYKSQSEALTRGHEIYVHDTEDDEWHNLSIDRFITGLSKALLHGFDLDNYDGPAADQVIQYALFGEIRYS